MYSLDQELAFATQKVREQRAVIAALQSELAAAREELERAREAVVKPWADALFFARPLCTMSRARELAEERYAREIAAAHKGEEG